MTKRRKIIAAAVAAGLILGLGVQIELHNLKKAEAPVASKAPAYTEAEVLGPEAAPRDIQAPRAPRPTIKAVAKALKLSGLKCAVVQDGPSTIEDHGSAQAERLLNQVERAWGMEGHLYCVVTGGP